MCVSIYTTGTLSLNKYNPKRLMFDILEMWRVADAC